MMHPWNAAALYTLHRSVTDCDLRSVSVLIHVMSNAHGACEPSGHTMINIEEFWSHWYRTVELLRHLFATHSITFDFECSNILE